MSRIPDLGKDFEKLPKIVVEYQTALEGYEDNLAIEGKLLEHANREQPAWQSFYDQKRIELYTLVKYLEAQVKKVRGKQFYMYTENYSRDLSDRAKDKYIDKDDAYLQKYELYLEIKELYEQYESVVEAFKARGYVLNNITKIRVSSLEDAVI